MSVTDSLSVLDSEHKCTKRELLHENETLMRRFYRKLCGHFQKYSVENFRHKSASLIMSPSVRSLSCNSLPKRSLSQFTPYKRRRFCYDKTLRDVELLDRLVYIRQFIGRTKTVYDMITNPSEGSESNLT